MDEPLSFNNRPVRDFYAETTPEWEALQVELADEEQAVYKILHPSYRGSKSRVRETEDTVLLADLPPDQQRFYVGPTVERSEVSP